MGADAIYAYRAGATRLLDLAFKDSSANLVKMGVLTLAIAIRSHHETSEKGMVDKVLLNILDATVKLCFAHPVVDDVLSDRASLPNDPSSPGHYYCLSATVFQVKDLGVSVQ
jgi:hypothetical protein